jgi:hypothetical protein
MDRNESFVDGKVTMPVVLLLVQLSLHPFHEQAHTCRLPCDPRDKES